MSFQEQVAGIINGVLAKPEYSAAIRSLAERVELGKAEERAQQLDRQITQPEENTIKENQGIEH